MRMIDVTDKHISKWGHGQKVDLFAELMRITLNNLSATIFGTNIGEREELVHHAAEVFLADFKFRFESGINLPRWIPTPAQRKFSRVKTDVDGLIDHMIQERKNDPEEHQDLLGVLLKAREEENSDMSDQQLRDELLTLMFAGHETTATTLAWTFSLLATHPEINKRLVQEFFQVFPDGRPTFDKLDQLKLTEMILLETMRLYPAAYMLGREAVQETSLNGYRVSPGTTVFMGTWVVHRDPRFWDQPDEFLPDRWVNGEGKFPENAYFPFGAGPRLCIGNHFALLECKLMLACMLLRFRFDPVHISLPTPWPTVTLRPKGGWPVRVFRQGESGTETLEPGTYEVEKYV